MATISSLSSRTHLLHHNHSARRPSKTPQPQNLSLKSLSPNPFHGLVLQTPRKHSPQRLFSVAAEETSTATSSPPSSRRLYVGNIPRNVTDDQLAKLFEEHGSIEKAEVMYDKYSKRSRRFGFVTMKTVEDANAAIEKLNGTEVDGRQIKVNVTEKPLDVTDLSILKGDETQLVDSPYKVYVGNLAKTVTSESLKKFFADEGKVLGAKVSRVPGTSKSTAFGFVTFASDEDAEAAINFFNNTILEGQRIRVNKA